LNEFAMYTECMSDRDAKCFSSQDRDFLEAVSGLVYANPFLPERIELEKRALGELFQADATNAWSKAAAWDRERPNVTALTDKVETLAMGFRDRLVDGATIAQGELTLYRNLVQYLLYYRVWDDLDQLIETPDRRTKVLKCWSSFQGHFDYFLKLPNREIPIQLQPAHLLACFFQIRRAFHHIFDFVLGFSAPAIQLRASIWQSIFTHDMQRYQRSLYQRMSDIPTMITGPSGTGKELETQAIGLSRYVPFNVQQRKFEEDYSRSFQPIHLAAMSPTLIESELFGHCKGAFTGATSERSGRLEACSDSGSVFLDEIGEVSGEIQVKLLRVLQSREFYRVGEAEARHFSGKVLTATNRDLVAEVTNGSFREDLYYRLCADTIRTPGLREQLSDSPDDLANLVQFIAQRVAGDDEAESVSAEAMQWIRTSLPAEYAWPGNIRELEQCVRNIMVRAVYSPVTEHCTASADELILRQMDSGSLSADELLQHYCAQVYAKTNSYEQTARMLKLDRRTVKSKVDAFHRRQVE
jgi:transcriptional regulator with AAA-type ATPase domain